MAKMGFIVLLLVFGGLLFVVGIQAPDDVRGKLQETFAKISQIIQNKTGGAPAAPQDAASKDATAQAPQAPAADGNNAQAAAPAAPVADKGAADAKGKKDAPIAYKTLLLSSTAPAKAKYAIQLRLSRNSQDIAYYQSLLTPFGYKSQVLSVVVGKDPADWQLLAVGQFDSIDDAQDSGFTLAKELSLPQAPPTIMLPPPPPKKPAAAAS